MAATVVCISRTDGSLGEFVGVAVASELGFRYVDHEVVARAAEKAQVDRATIADAERRKSFVRRLFDSLPAPSLVGDMAVGMPAQLQPAIQFPMVMEQRPRAIGVHHQCAPGKVGRKRRA